MILGELLRYGAQRLGEVSDTARLDAELLLGHLLLLTKTQLITERDRQISDEEQDAFEKLLARREKHEPIAYILGEREFYGRSFTVTPDVLIPRPETELLIEQALAVIDAKQIDTVLELGTGSGCIAITLAAERANLKVVATDLSSEALTVARKNAESLGVLDRIDFLQGSWFEPIQKEQRFSLIVSNPPYVAEDEWVYPGASYEPQSALFSDDAGLSDIKTILTEGQRFVSPSGVVLIEHGHRQGQRLSDFVREAALPYSDVRIISDLGDRERVLSVTRSNDIISG